MITGQGLGCQPDLHSGQDNPECSKPLQVEFPLNTGRDMQSRSAQVNRLFAVGRGQKRQELVMILLGRVVVLVFVREETDGDLPGGQFVLSLRGYKELSSPVFLMRTSFLHLQLKIMRTVTVH